MKIDIEELKMKLEKVEQPFDPPLEVWQQFSPSFATVVMRGAMDAVLELDEESKNMVLREAGAACSDLLQAHEVGRATHGTSVGTGR